MANPGLFLVSRRSAFGLYHVENWAFNIVFIGGAMASHRDFVSAQGRRLAYQRILGKGPEIVFLGGFKSDMQGKKALHLAQWATRRGRRFLRFDYSGHGQSSGLFCDGCIGDWLTNQIIILEPIDSQVFFFLIFCIFPSSTERLNWAYFSSFVGLNKYCLIQLSIPKFPGIW